MSNMEKELLKEIAECERKLKRENVPWYLQNTYHRWIHTNKQILKINNLIGE